MKKILFIAFVALSSASYGQSQPLVGTWESVGYYFRDADSHSIDLAKAESYEKLMWEDETLQILTFNEDFECGMIENDNAYTYRIVDNYIYIKECLEYEDDIEGDLGHPDKMAYSIDGNKLIIAFQIKEDDDIATYYLHFIRE